MNKRGIFFLVLMLLFILIGIIAAAGLPGTTGELQPAEQEGLRLTLGYEHQKEFDPDRARLVVGVETEDTDREAAFENNNQKMKQIMESLEEENIISLETTSFRVTPRTREEEGQRVVYYQVSNNIALKTDVLEEVGRLIELSFNAGANRITSLNYMLSDESAAQDEVLAEALLGLKSKAGFIKENLDLDEVQMITLNIEDRGYFRPTEFRMETMDAAATPPPISPQNIEINVSLNAEFRLY